MKNIQIYILAMIISFISLCNLSAADLRKVTSKDLGFTSESQLMQFADDLHYYAFQVGKLKEFATASDETKSKAKEFLEKTYVMERFSAMDESFTKMMHSGNRLGSLLHGIARRSLREGIDMAASTDQILDPRTAIRTAIFTVEDFTTQYKQQIDMIINLGKTGV